MEEIRKCYDKKLTESSNVDDQVQCLNLNCCQRRDVIKENDEGNRAEDTEKSRNENSDKLGDQLREN